MSEHILIPLDGSELGEAALRYVEAFVGRLAPGEKIKVTLFHAITQVTHTISVGGGNTVAVPYSEDELNEQREKAEGYLERVGAGLRGKGAVVDCLVAVGNPPEEIIRAEEEVKADLVAMSTHGRAGLSRWAFGSVTDKVLRAGKVPVLMVRAQKAKR